ncbi:hypothetical protein HYPSUDRAFT_216924 [Hypholoma sublateritium FD-334 SS-4]|uniref:Uncharacterized protein n=1 Tax=Hypholoma sublateritium (strain FD-334 SS-4) TaxID=945553 RepID=A0A0D2NVJ4_HYPSF|nr:hypothetical protein HYPSUDRAFT_216924 [Hypholoma sublateritium FD-334 SS-4]
MGSLLEFLGRLWAAIVAYFQGTRTESPSVLPLTMVSSRAKPHSSNGRHRADQDSSEIWQNRKEEFIRHPSVRATKKGRQAQKSKPKTPKKAHRRHKSGHVALPTLLVQDWNTLASSAYSQPPPRPPRPWSTSVPAVIITPSTPTGDGRLLSINQEYIYSTPRASPLDLTIATFSPKQDTPTVRLERQWSSGGAEKPGADPPTAIALISEQAVKHSEHHVLATPSKIPPTLESPEKSLDLTVSLDSIKIKATLQGLKGLLRSTPPWLNFDSFTQSDRENSLNSYTTSTPVKKSLAGTAKAVAAEMLILPVVESPQSLSVPDDEMDLLPYPDVFDLDLYYGMQSARRSSASTTTADPSSSFVHCSSDGKNPFTTVTSPPYLNSSSSPNSSPSDLSETPQPKRDVFVPQTPIIRTDNGVTRFRDYLRHHTLAGSPQASSENTSGESAMHSTPTPYPRAMSLRTTGRAALSLSSRANKANALSQASTLARIAPRGKIVFSSMASRAPLAMTTRANINPPPPIVVVSHHRFGSVSQNSQSEPPSDASREVLKARLRETLDNFSKSISTTENSTSTEELVTPRRMF